MTGSLIDEKWQYNHWILCQLTGSTNLIHGQGTKVLFVATSDRLPSHSVKKAGEPQTAVSLTKAPQCAVLMDIAG